jgi:hypothetical protein
VLGVCEEGTQSGREQDGEHPKADFLGSHRGVIDDTLEMLPVLIVVCRNELIERHIAFRQTNAHTLQAYAQEQSQRGVPKEGRNHSVGLHRDCRNVVSEKIKPQENIPRWLASARQRRHSKGVKSASAPGRKAL